MPPAAIALSLILAALTPAAQAQVYKCTGPDGKTIFTDQPCATHAPGTLIQRARTPEERAQDEANASLAEEHKTRRRERAQQDDMAQQQRQTRQQAQSSAQQAARSEIDCKEAKKELEFVSRITQISARDKRIRTNAAITQVNAACGTNTELMQEPIRAPQPPVLTHCDNGFCYDDAGRIYQRNGPDSMVGPNGRPCHQVGNRVQCN